MLQAKWDARCEAWLKQRKLIEAVATKAARPHEDGVNSEHVFIMTFKSLKCFLKNTLIVQL